MLESREGALSRPLSWFSPSGFSSWDMRTIEEHGGRNVPAGEINLNMWPGKLYGALDGVGRRWRVQVSVFEWRQIVLMKNFWCSTWREQKILGFLQV